MGADGEVVATEGEGEIRERINLVTFDAVLSSKSLFGTDFFVPVGELALLLRSSGKSMSHLQKFGHS